MTAVTSNALRALPSLLLAAAIGLPAVAFADGSSVDAGTSSCAEMLNRGYVELRVDDLDLPPEITGLYESQLEVRAEGRLRAGGIARRFPTAGSRCVLRISVAHEAGGYRVRVALGDPKGAAAAFSAEETVSPQTGSSRSTTAGAILAAVDRQVDRFVATQGSGRIPVAGTGASGG